ncbi:MAG: ImmA/IrrE family metallo-endopeptidase [Methanosarcinales archaeon]|nr:MAG: ImmA/IrrE family metallo-endopeptidase [Methanosarcinales archaeon]
MIKMPKESLTMKIESEVFKWLKDSSGWNNEELAKRLKTSVETIKKFETGEKDPSLRQLRELSTIFKRPIASFFLSKPKLEKPKPKDYRLIPEKENQFDKKTLLVLRKSRHLQQVAKELSININYKIDSKLKRGKISEKPEIIAKYYRDLVQLSEEKQIKFKNPYELFHYLRDVLEELNIYVFQFSMPVEDARGFVFVDDTPYIIAVNTADSIEARLFSLMHEFAHILLGESVIDMPDPFLSSRSQIVKWCNEFSASFLLPKNLAIKLFDSHRDNLTEKSTLKTLSNRYKISKAMLLVNMNRLNYISNNDLNTIINIKPKVKKEGKSKGGVGIPSDKKRLSEMGNKFISLVANNFDKEKITYTDALNYLSIKSKKFNKLLSQAKK